MADIFLSYAREDREKAEPLAQSRNVLVSVLLDDAELPLGFRQQQTANLAAWTGATSDPEFQLLAEGIATLVGGGGVGAAASSGDVVPPTHVRESAPVRRSVFPPMTRSTVAALAVIA